MKAITLRDDDHWHELRASVLTSTDASAMFGLSPYMTKYELWHRKKSQDRLILGPSERMNWGNRLEEAIALGAAEDNKWMIMPFKEFVINEHLKIGSSFDYKIMSPEIAILEVKNVDSMAFRKNWNPDDDGAIESTPYIELQIQHQMLVSGIKKAYIAALVGGNELTIVERIANKEIQDAILDGAASFWKSIEENNPPKPNYVEDAAFIASIYNKSDSKKTMDETKEIKKMVDEYKQAADMEKAAKKTKDSVKAQILEVIKDNSKVKGETFTISAGMTKASTYTVTRGESRMFKIHHKKKKENTNEQTDK